MLIVVARYVVRKGHDSTVARLLRKNAEASRAGMPRILGLPGDRRSPGVLALRAVHERGGLPGPPEDAALRGHHRAAGRAAPGRACLDTHGTAAQLISENAYLLRAWVNSRSAEVLTGQERREGRTITQITEKPE
jgi:hypothetical protein